DVIDDDLELVRCLGPTQTGAEPRRERPCLATLDSGLAPLDQIDRQSDIHCLGPAPLHTIKYTMTCHVRQPNPRRDRNPVAATTPRYAAAMPAAGTHPAHLALDQTQLTIIVVAVLLIVGMLVARIVVLARRTDLSGYRFGADVVVRCRDGHLFTTTWIP